MNAIFWLVVAILAGGIAGLFVWALREPPRDDAAQAIDELTDEERARLALVAALVDIHRTARESWGAHVPEDQR